MNTAPKEYLIKKLQKVPTMEDRKEGKHQRITENKRPLVGKG
jgi:hypothetical protein